MNPNISQHYEFYNYQYPPYRQFILAPIGSWNYDCADEYSDTPKPLFYLLLKMLFKINVILLLIYFPMKSILTQLIFVIF